MPIIVFLATGSTGSNLKQKTVSTSLTKMAQCGVEKYVTIDGVTKSKSFHSMRHYLVNYFDKKISPRIKNFIIGHKYESGSVSDYIYSDAGDLKNAHNVLTKFDYPSIYFSKIRK